jgi:parallel beta-helix repeat protein
MYTSGSNVYFIENLVDSNGRTPLNFTGYGDAILKENFVINNNSSSSTGPAIRCSLTGNVLIADNEIAYNKNTVAPTGGIYNGSGLGVVNAASAIIANNNIHHNVLDRLINTSILSGAGIYADIAGDSLMIIGNKIYNNAVLKYCLGGGVYITKGLLINNLIVNNGAYGNSPYGRGGGVYAADSVIIINNTIANNYAFGEGGGIYFYGGKMSQFKNNIIYGNTVRPSGLGKQLYCYNGTLSPLNNNFDIAFCDIEGGYNAIAHSYSTIIGTIYQNNLDTIPFFVNPSTGTSDSTDATLSDFNLQAASSLINFGDSSQVDFNTDIIGNDRIFDTQIDLGAYEYQSVIIPQVTALFNVLNTCVNSSINIINTSSNAINYNWQMIGAAPSSDTQASPVISYSSPGAYQIQLIASNGTDSDTTVQSITIYPLPIVNAGVDVGICSGSNVTLNATTSGGSLSYNWSPTSTLSAPTLNQTLASPAISTDYVITVNDGLCTNYDTVTVTVWPLLPNPVITQVGNNLEATLGFAAYQWYENNNIITGETQSLITPTSNGNYTVDAIDTNGCISTSQAFPFVIQGVSAISNSEIIIYPNPASTVLNIVLDVSKMNTQIEISNVQGEIILSQKNNLSLNQFNIENIANGIYFVRIGNEVRKFVKLN